jgi:hypothetical protein
VRSRPRRHWAATLTVAALFLLAATRWSLASRAETPAQPIEVSHVVHAGDDKLSCELCHATARRSSFAGIAPVERCIGCHRYINPANPEIGKVRAYFDANEPIPWQRVYVLPRFVHFSHESHFHAGVDCAECHGEVQRMEHLARVRELTMGWCMECHRQRGASDDCLTCHY